MDPQSVFRLTGTSSIFAGKVFNVILSILTMPVIFTLVYRWTKNFIISVCVLALIAILPNYIAYTNLLGTEVLFVFLFSSILLVQTINFRNKYIRYIILGILIGILASIKANFMVYPIILIITDWLKNKNVKEAVLGFLIVSIFTAIAISPWTILNFKNFDRIIPVSYNGDVVLYINNNSENQSGKYMDVGKVPASDEFLQKFEEIGVEYGVISDANANALYGEEAEKWIKANPIQFIKLGILRVGNVFFKGANDILYFSMVEFIANEEISQRTINTFQFLIGLIVYVLSSVTLLYSCISVFFVLKNLINKKVKIGYIYTTPTINFFFIALVHFFFEGQSRYIFPILFLMSIATVYVVYFFSIL